jgi:hypothetical protein
MVKERRKKKKKKKKSGKRRGNFNNNKITGREGPPVGAGPKVDAAPGLPGRSPIPVLFRPKGA